MLNVRVASMARIASLILRVNVGSSPKRRVLMSCCVIVEPPCEIVPLAAFAFIARTMPPKSTPGFVQNDLSSMAIVASCIFCGTASRLMSSRRSSSSVYRRCSPERS